ncbi:hypothetical protein [Tepidiforma sp.]|nr:hypothetical protein [Tepidiforma sp.]
MSDVECREPERHAVAKRIRDPDAVGNAFANAPSNLVTDTTAPG